MALLATACSALTARVQATVRPDGRPANRSVVFRHGGVLLCFPSVGACLTPARAQGLPGRHGAADVCDGRAQQQGTASEQRARHVCQSLTPLTAPQVLEIAHCPLAEVCWYFPITREQYRLSGARERANACRHALSPSPFVGRLRIVDHACVDAGLLEARALHISSSCPVWGLLTCPVSGESCRLAQNVGGWALPICVASPRAASSGGRRRAGD